MINRFTYDTYTHNILLFILFYYFRLINSNYLISIREMSEKSSNASLALRFIFCQQLIIFCEIKDRETWKIVLYTLCKNILYKISVKREFGVTNLKVVPHWSPLLTCSDIKWQLLQHYSNS